MRIDIIGMFLLKALLFCLLGCAGRTDQVSVSDKLSGKWISLGFYNQGQPDYDTLYWQFTDEFDGSISEMKTIIWTDSGTFSHVYSTEDDSLLRIEKVVELSIGEFEFLTDSTGTLFSYELDTANENPINQKEYASTEDFKLTLKDSRNLLTFTWPNDTVVVSEILTLTDNELILGFGHERTSRFKKMNMP